MPASKHEAEIVELERLLAAHGASELGAHDHARLAEILRGNGEALELYVAHCQLQALLSGEKGLLADLAGDPPLNILAIPAMGGAADASSGSDEVWDDAAFEAEWAASEADDLSQKSPRRRAGIAWGAAALLTLSAVAAALLSGFHRPGLQILTDAPTAGSGADAGTETPESQYQNRMTAIAAAGGGSQKRPPTTFISTSAGSAEGEIRFNRDILPILSENCFACHGPDAAARKAGLRLDTKEGAFAVNPDSGAAPFVAGDPDQSEAYFRIITDDEDDLMPPPKSHKILTSKQKDVIRRWIEGGARWEEHWAFITPIRPEVPAVPSGAVAGKGDWTRSPADAFLLTEMARHGLAPSPEADRPTLIRRVTLDLTGLPPTPQEVAAFESDTAPDAYEKVVDRLLVSPRFGEHRARYWLDAVRYADTHGFHLDNYRSIWPYRDWVVRAFNENKPFDAFAIEQIAGDLLPSPTEDQLVATGFNRCNPTTSEGGIIDEEFLAVYAKDRTDTTATVFMGLTMGCASCHDHKFDPITQSEYYQMLAFFNHSEVPAKDGNRADHAPVIKIVPESSKRRAVEIDAQIASLRARLKGAEDEAREKFAVWEKSISAGMFSESIPATGLAVHLPLDGEGGNPAANLASPEAAPLALPDGARWQTEGKSGSALALSGSGGLDIGPEFGDFEKDQPFSYGGWIHIPKGFKGSAGIFAKMDEKALHRGWDLWIQEGVHLAAHFIHTWSDNALKVTTQKPVLKPERWTHVFVTYDGSAKPAGVRIYVDGVPQPHTPEADSLHGSIRTPTSLRLGQRSDAAAFTGSLDEFRLYGRALDPAEVAALAGSAHLRDIVEGPLDKRSPAQREMLFDYFIATQVPGVGERRTAIASLEVRREALMADAVTTLVMREKPGEAFAHILERGEYDHLGERVTAGVPEVFADLPEAAPPNRLALARWLVDPSHPLTARVTVNRFWQQMFGTGIVKTAEDLGVMGEPPTHPGLLDWLAVEFRESGWDVKHIFRIMATSAAYRQSAKIAGDHLKIDPANRYLARGPRHRLDAEVLRDQALFAAGLLGDEIGGAPVKPYQPPGLWETVAYPTSDTAKYVQDTGDKLYRRSLYTFWKRTSSPPNMTLFDAPDRESCTVRRERTNTPLQALVLMNDPQFVEASRHLASRVLRDPNTATTESRIDALHRLVLSAPVPDRTLAVLARCHGHFKGAFTGRPEGAQELIGVGDSPPDNSVDPIELATWTLVANQILNTDSAINKP